MKIRKCFVSLVAFLAFASCGGGVSTEAEPSPVDGELLLVSDTIDSDGIIRLGFGDSFSFSVAYNGAAVDDFDCRVLDEDGDEILSGGGTLACEDGEGNYTAPSSVPEVGSYLKLEISVALLDITLQNRSSKSSGAVTAEIEILLPCEYTSNCTASSAPLCMYSQCVAYSSIGVNRSQDSCTKQSDCSGEDMCLSFDRNSCDSGYCVDVEDVFTLSASNCEDGGGVMVEAESDDYSVCVTGDVMACVSEDDDDGGGSSGPPECNPTLTNDCFQYNGTSQEVCETYYWEAFDEFGNYDVRNCRYWDGICGVEGSYGDTSTACTGGSCGNDICEAELGENSGTCKQDCGTGGGYTCPNGVCEDWAGENSGNCPAGG